MAKLKDRYGLLPDPPGEWVSIEGYDTLPECPECGSGPDEPCTTPLEGEDHAVEIGSYMHLERWTAMGED